MSFNSYFSIVFFLYSFTSQCYFFQCLDHLNSDIEQIDIGTDINELIRTRGTKRQPGEQIVFTCFVRLFLFRSVLLSLSDLALCFC